MFGQSAGGFTAAQTMYEDPRVKVGIDMDGTLGFGQNPATAPLSPVAAHGLNRPFLLMGSSGKDGSSHLNEATWTAFWSHDRGWKADLTLNDSGHGSFTDAEALLPQLKINSKGEIGTVNPKRAIAAEEAFISSFFDRWLRGHDDHLLDGGGHPDGYPVTFVH